MKNYYKVIIIDDDELAIENLSFELKAYPQLQIEGIARNGFSAKKLIPKIMPDLLFLDIELPDMSGFELLRLLGEELTWEMKIIFYTAYNKYMLEAIRNAAFDYLLKPIDRDDFANMIKRFFEKTEAQPTQAAPLHIQIRNLSPLNQTFIVPSLTNDLQFLRPDDVGYFKYNSNRKLWEIYLCNTPTPIALRKNVSAEQILSSSPVFVQIHQSHIININYLVMIKDKKCIFYPPFNNVNDIQVSKAYLKKIQEKFLML